MADTFIYPRYLPKCWLARIDKYWYPKLPNDYPETATIFDFVQGEDKAAVIDMENNLGTENSIISVEDVPEKEAVGAYLGTFEVNAEPGETTLISPNKLPESAVGVLAYHYDSDENTWNLIDSTEIVDGYVYATLEEFSPIAVFALTRAPYIMDVQIELPRQTGNVLVCNGIPTKVYLENDKIIAESGLLKFELEENDSIIGGSADGTDVKSTNLMILDGVKLNYVIGGSWITSVDSIESKNHTENIKVFAKNATIGILTGAGVWNCADLVEITTEGCTIERGMGSQMAFYEHKSSNKTLEDSDKGLGANQWVKKAIVKAKDSTIEVLYAGGSNGMCTTLDAEMTVENCKCTYLCNGQSNGTIYNVKSTVKGTEVDYFNNSNRGHYGDGKVIFNGGNDIKEGFVFCDNEPNVSMADVRGKIYIDINATDKFESFTTGSISNVEVTDAATAAKYIDTIKISRNADVVYTRNADVILKDIIRIK